jgi:hypothetical protein
LNSTPIENGLSSMTSSDDMSEIDPILINTVNLCQNWSCFKIFYQNKQSLRNHGRATCCLSCASSLGTFRKKY